MRCAASLSAGDLNLGPVPGPSQAWRWFGSSCARVVRATPCLLAANTVGSHKLVPVRESSLRSVYGPVFRHVQ